MGFLNLSSEISEFLNYQIKCTSKLYFTHKFFDWVSVFNNRKSPWIYPLLPYRVFFSLLKLAPVFCFTTLTTYRTLSIRSKSSFPSFAQCIWNFKRKGKAYVILFYPHKFYWTSWTCRDVLICIVATIIYDTDLKWNKKSLDGIQIQIWEEKLHEIKHPSLSVS